MQVRTNPPVITFDKLACNTLYNHHVRCDTVIVSVGETRRFNLREIQSQKNSDNEQEHHSFHLVDGDAFYMMGDCQDTYQHAILKSEGTSLSLLQ